MIKAAGKVLAYDAGNIDPKWLIKGSPPVVRMTARLAGNIRRYDLLIGKDLNVSIETKLPDPDLPARMLKIFLAPDPFAERERS